LNPALARYFAKRPTLHHTKPRHLRRSEHRISQRLDAATLKQLVSLYEAGTSAAASSLGVMTSSILSTGCMASVRKRDKSC